MRCRHALGLFALAILAACTPAPPDTTVPEQGFAHMTRLPLKVAEIELQQEMQPPPEHGRRVDTLTNPALATMLGRWKDARLHAAGASGEAVVIINKAEIVETRPRFAAEMVDAKKLEPQDLYAGTIQGAIRLLLVDDAGRTRRSTITAIASRRLSLPASSTLSARELAWNGLASRLIADFDAEIERRLGEEGWIIGIDFAPETDSATDLYYNPPEMDSREILAPR